MPTFDSIDKLRAYLLSKISIVMDNDVAEVIKKEESKQIEKYYDKFEPKYYQRRKSNGGLSDIRNMRSKTIISGNSVKTIIVNETIGNERYSESQSVVQNLAGVFASGLGYDYYSPDMKKTYARPRPAHENTVEQLLNNRRHISALIEGLGKLGIKAY